MPLVGVNAFATAAPLVDKMVVVSEEFIALAILRLVEMEKAVVEGAGATGIAAVLAGLLPELQGKKYVYNQYYLFRLCKLSCSLHCIFCV